MCAPGRLAAEAPEREVRIARRRAAAEQKRVVAQTVSTVVGECKRERGRERRAPESGGCTLRCALGSSDSPPRVCIFLIFTCPSKTGASTCPSKMYTRPPHDDHTGLDSHNFSHAHGDRTRRHALSLSLRKYKREKKGAWRRRSLPLQNKHKCTQQHTATLWLTPPPPAPRQGRLTRHHSTRAL